jgi:hypothetical protein
MTECHYCGEVVISKGITIIRGDKQVTTKYYHCLNCLRDWLPQESEDYLNLKFKELEDE